MGHVDDIAYPLPAELLSPASSHYRFRTLNEIPPIARRLAVAFPDYYNALLGISELMLNAIEHGNLGIDYESKRELMANGFWKTHIEMLLAHSPLGKREASVTSLITQEKITLTVSDEGDGFDPTPHLHLPYGTKPDANGRGIALCRLISFDELEYHDGGTTVQAVKFL